MKVPFLNLVAAYEDIKEEVLPAIENTIAHCQFTLGPAVNAFEKDFASYCGVSEAVGVNSGTSALHMALLAAGIGKGDEVITVAHTFVATVAAILYAGAKPVLVDIDPERMTMDPNKIEAAITPRTKAIIPVHLYGQPAAMDHILSIARQHRVLVIEDACQAHGARYNGKRAGSLGDMGCFSFYPGKNLGAYGEGGAVTTSNQELARKTRIFRDWGAEKRYHHDVLGFNARMEGIQGAVLGIRLKRLDELNDRRREVAKIYSKGLVDLPLVIPVAAPECQHVYHLYAVRTPRRDELLTFLQEKEVYCGIHYPTPVHLQKGYACLGYAKGDFPVSEKTASEELSLPMCPYLSEEQANYVVSRIREFFS